MRSTLIKKLLMASVMAFAAYLGAFVLDRAFIEPAYCRANVTHIGKPKTDEIVMYHNINGVMIAQPLESNEYRVITLQAFFGELQTKWEGDIEVGDNMLIGYGEGRFTGDIFIKEVSIYGDN